MYFDIECLNELTHLLINYPVTVTTDCVDPLIASYFSRYRFVEFCSAVQPTRSIHLFITGMGWLRIRNRMRSFACIYWLTVKWIPHVSYLLATYSRFEEVRTGLGTRWYFILDDQLTTEVAPNTEFLHRTRYTSDPVSGFHNAANQSFIKSSATSWTGSWSTTIGHPYNST